MSENKSTTNKSRREKAATSLTEAENSINTLREKATNSLTEVENSINTLCTEVEACKNKYDEINETLKNVDLNQIKETLKELTVIHQSSKPIYSEIQEYSEELQKKVENFEKFKKLSKNLYDDSKKLYDELTDQSLHDAFKRQAKEKRKIHYIYLGFSTVFAALSVAGPIYIFYFSIGNIGVITDSLINLWITRVVVISMFSPLYCLTYIFNSKSNIAMEFAEYYQHKASISEALSGYRSRLESSQEGSDSVYDNPEYQQLYEYTILQLMKNPAEAVKFSKIKIQDNSDRLKSFDKPNLDS